MASQYTPIVVKAVEGIATLDTAAEAQLPPTTEAQPALNDPSLSLLAVGHVIKADDVIRTLGGRVTVETPDGRTFTLEEGELYTYDRIAKAAGLNEKTDGEDEVLIADEGDITAELEAPAAGPAAAGGGAGDGGTTFVSIDPNYGRGAVTAGYPTGTAGQGTEQLGGPGDENLFNFIDVEPEPVDVVPIIISLSGATLVDEGSTANYTVSYTGTLAAGEIATVQISNVDGTALNLDDYGDLVAQVALTPGITFNPATGIITFTGGLGNATVINFDVPIVDDILVEGIENYQIIITNPSPNAVLGNDTVSIDINDTMGPDGGSDQVIFFIEGPTNVDEGAIANYTLGYDDGPLGVGVTASITLNLNDIDTTSADYANFITAIQIAVAGRADVSFDPGTLTVMFTGTGAEQLPMVIGLEAIDDIIAEGPEDFQVVLSNPDSSVPNGAVLDPARDDVITTINDTMGPGGDPDNIFFYIEGPSNIDEGDVAQYNVGYDGVLKAGEIVTVQINLSNIDTTNADYADFLAAVQNAVVGRTDVSFDVGTATFTWTGTGEAITPINIDLLAINDIFVEGPEDFNITLFNPNSLTDAEVKIDPARVDVTTTIDDTMGPGGDPDSACFFITGPDEIVEGNTGIYTVGYDGGILLLNSIATVHINLTDLSTHPNDYSDFLQAVTDAASGRADVTFDPGTMTLTWIGTGALQAPIVIELDAIDDLINEGSEFFQISLSNPTLSTPGGDIKITDNKGSVTTEIIDDQVPVGGGDNALVKEAALGLGLIPPRQDGTNPSSTEETVMDTLSYSFSVDGPAATDPFVWSDAVIASDPDGGRIFTGLTSDGDTIEFNVSADGLTIIGTVDPAGTGEHVGSEVIKISMTDINTGAYEVMLLGPVDHPDIDETGVDDPIILDFSYTLTDGNGDTSTGVLSVTVLDDALIGKDDKVIVDESGVASQNIVFVLDVSGSMGWEIDPATGDTVGGPGSPNRLELLKSALGNLVDEIANGAAPAIITFVPFSSGDGKSGGAFSTIQYDLTTAQGLSDAQAFITSLEVGLGPLGTGTEYDDALIVTRGEIEADLTNPALLGFENTVYFLSDGQPSNGQGAPADWQAFVDGNDINVIPVGIGDFDTSGLESVGNHGDTIIQVLNPFDLEATLMATIEQSVVNGNIIDNEMFGADGPHDTQPVLSFEHHGNLYDSHTQVGDPGVISVTGTVITIETELGGEFSLDLSTGEYEYTSAQVDQDEDEQFIYTIQDNDGDTASATLTVCIKDNIDPPGGAHITVFDKQCFEDAEANVVFQAGAPAKMITINFNVTLDNPAADDVTGLSISGVPAGVVLVGWTDQGGGVHTLDNIGPYIHGGSVDVKINVPRHWDEDLGLTVSAEVTNTHSQQSVLITSNTSLDVKFDAVAAQAEVDNVSILTMSGDEIVSPGEEALVTFNATFYDITDDGTTDNTGEEQQFVLFQVPDDWTAELNNIIVDGMPGFSAVLAINPPTSEGTWYQVNITDYLDALPGNPDSHTAEIGVNLTAPIDLEASVGFKWDYQGSLDNEKGGDVESIHTQYNPSEDCLTFTMVISDVAHNTTDGFTLVLNNGPDNPKGEDNLAIFYFDNSSGTPILTVYPYNGENSTSSCQDSEPVASSIFGNQDFLKVLSATSVGSIGNQTHTYTFSVDSSLLGLNAQAELGEQLGIWLHPMSYLDVDYDHRGDIIDFDFKYQGWLDLAHQETTPCLEKPSLDVAAVSVDINTDMDITLDNNRVEDLATLQIFIEDNDVPVAKDDKIFVGESSVTQQNLVFVIDVSVNMGFRIDPVTGEIVGGSGSPNHLELLKAALDNLVDKVASGDAHAMVTLVPYASGHGPSGGAFSSGQFDISTAAGLAAAKNFIAGLDVVEGTLGTGTKYDDVLIVARAELEANLVDLALVDHETTVYFLSEGMPNNGQAASADWQAFVDVNNINVITVGIGECDTASLESVGISGGVFIQVLNPFDLDVTLMATLNQGMVTGNVLTNDMPGDDGYHPTQPVVSFEHNGNTYDNTSQVGDPGVISVVGLVITVETELGGELRFDLSNGDYKYTAPRINQDEDEQFIYTIQDNDGDISTAMLEVCVKDNTNPPCGAYINVFVQAGVPAQMIMINFDVTLDNPAADGVTGLSISGVPVGFVLVGWTDQGGGVHTLDNIGSYIHGGSVDVNVNVPRHWDEDLSLTVSAEVTNTHSQQSVWIAGSTSLEVQFDAIALQTEVDNVSILTMSGDENVTPGEEVLISFTNVQCIDLRDVGEEMLTLSETDVLKITNTDDTLQVLGDTSDQVQLEGAWAFNGQVTVDTVVFNQYIQGSATVQIQEDVQQVIV